MIGYFGKLVKLIGLLFFFHQATAQTPLFIEPFVSVNYHDLDLVPGNKFENSYYNSASQFFKSTDTTNQSFLVDIDAKPASPLLNDKLIDSLLALTMQKMTVEEISDTVEILKSKKLEIGPFKGFAFTSRHIEEPKNYYFTSLLLAYNDLGQVSIFHHDKSASKRIGKNHGSIQLLKELIDNTILFNKDTRDSILKLGISECSVDYDSLPCRNKYRYAALDSNGSYKTVFTFSPDSLPEYQKNRRFYPFLRTFKGRIIPNSSSDFEFVNFSFSSYGPSRNKNQPFDFYLTDKAKGLAKHNGTAKFIHKETGIPIVIRFEVKYYSPGAPF
ncbi:MAG: hypothetical protein ACPGLV_02115 [Bacteroidia bacterium]